MKFIVTILGLGITCGFGADEKVACPVCQKQAVEIATQKDDTSKPSRNLRVWNRSICANLSFGEGSFICPIDGYAYEAQLKHWELSQENRDSFAHPLDHRISQFPLPDQKRIKSRTVYSQEFETLGKVRHSLLFWTVIDAAYFKKLQEFSKTKGIDLEIRPHEDRGEAIVTASVTKETAQDAEEKGEKR